MKEKTAKESGLEGLVEGYRRFRSAEYSVQKQLFEALARGFTEAAGESLGKLERSLLTTGARVITFEQAVRFLTDHLEGDPYYRVAHPGHNLQRARTQLRLLEQLEEHDAELERIVESL